MEGKTSQNRLPGNMSGDTIGDRFHEEKSDHPGSRSDSNLVIDLLGFDRLEEAVLTGELSLLMHYFKDELQTIIGEE